jgi:predicted DNA-binding antitoxin AbrB/MazE fold protein
MEGAMMATITIRAVYEHGVFRPVEPLNLPESTTVEIAISAHAVAAESSRAQLRAALRATGLQFVEPDPTLTARLPSIERQRELALLFSRPESIADALLADREERW